MKYYPLLCVVQLLSMQEFCNIFHCPYYASKHIMTYSRRTPLEPRKCSTIKQISYRKSFHVLPLNICCISLCSPMHEMHLNKLRIRAHVVEIREEKYYSSKRSAFTHWTHQPFYYLNTLFPHLHFYMESAYVGPLYLSFNFSHILLNQPVNINSE